MASNAFILGIIAFCGLYSLGEAIQCYQCDSNEDASCPSNRGFDKNVNALVDCSSLEAHTPGVFCMKISQQSPGWGSWKKITRRCGSRSDTGVALGCRWTFEENGVWREVCYCEDRDGCNSASLLSVNTVFITIIASIVILYKYIQLS